MHSPRSDFHFCHLKSLFLKLSIILLIFASCNSRKQEKSLYEIPAEEREWLTQFFSDIMLSESGIYTLWGATKPITLITVNVYSENEKKAYYESLTEEEIKNGLVIEGYSLDETWKKWEQVSDRFPLKRFMLFKCDSLEDSDPHVFFVIFVDILKTAAVIQDNYEAFQKAMGFDFHPLELTLQINQKDSVFWKNLNSYHYGLLFGFGKINSQLFHWKHFDHPKLCDEFCNNISPSFSNETLKWHIKFTTDNFQTPSFMSFNEIDPTVDIYEKERKKIKNIYKDKDFLETTLYKLMN